ncbi:hypothetical protein [Gulosibacter chungangensis]|uniref:Uncharacterized protein n=1 Tax=Gulosibacter chungangensis TaxID=979746 RepID=A0A7J5BFC6_9MICO|nr:hypothetical protein [Gulosibacter chungangensis]KAB1644963.1 hypothetical protein F8O05_01485 [Gulosibacter chungangensis]
MDATPGAHRTQKLSRMPRTGRGALSALGIVLLGGMLAGCTDGGADPALTEIATDAATSNETPVETAPELTDEEALQIAVETYEEYLAATGKLLDTNGESFDEVQAITTPNMAKINQDSLELAQQGNYTTDGTMPVVKSQIQLVDGDSIDAYVCVDFSQSQTFDEDGNPVGGSRDGIQRAYEIRVVKDQGIFKVDRSELWADSSFCSE